MSTLRRKALALTGLLVLTGTLAACSSDGDSSAPAASGSVRTVISSDPASFDPALAQGGGNFQIDSLLYDTLVRRDDDGKLVGGLATEWQAKSASDYVFTIRDKATFSDGSAVTATAVAESLKHLASRETKSTWRNLIFGLGDATITADDSARTVQITLSEPYSILPRGLSIAQSGIVGPTGLADPTALAAGSTTGAFSGPYTLTKANKGIEYELTLRDGYDSWPAFAKPLTGHPAEKVYFGVGNDESTVANQVIAGDVQLGQFFTGGAASRFSDGSGYNIYRNTQYTMYLVFNERPGHPFAGHPELRKAVAQALDAAQFNTIFTDGKGQLIQSVQPGTVVGANTDGSLVEKYDPAAAKAVLSGLKGVHFLQQDIPTWKDITEYATKQLSDAGVEVTADPIPSTDYWVTLAKGTYNWDIAFIGDLNTVGAISASLDRVSGPSVENGGRNYGASDNTAANDALAAGLAATDQDEQNRHFLTAQKELLQRDDVVPFDGVPGTYVAASNVTVRVFGDYVDFATLRLDN